MITLKNYKTRFPNNNSEYFDSLTFIEKKEYLNLLEKYYDLTLSFLIDKLNLKFYDNLLKRDSDFPLVSEKNMDLYQYLSFGELDYFYLRNNFYIEHLEKDEFEYLKKVDVKSDECEFIEKTLKKVISENVDTDVEYCFGNDNLEFFKTNGSLIIGVRYNEFLKKVLKNENWSNYYLAVQNKLCVILERLRLEFKSLNGIPISVLVYNDYSVVSLNGEFEEQEAKMEDIQKADVIQTVDTSKNIEQETIGNNIIFY